MNRMKKQAERFGAEFQMGNVTQVNFKVRPFQIMVEDEKLRAEAVIIASGASAQWLGLESEKKFKGRGVSTCATCDGAFFKGQDVVVVGGGDSAMEEATFLSRFCRKIYVVHRRNAFRASKIMVARARKNPKIQFIFDSVVEEIRGDKTVESVILKNLLTQEQRELSVHGLFLTIGHVPNTKVFKGQVDMDDMGYLKTQPDSTFTNIPRVFVAGDVQDKKYRQAITAAGSGCRAAIDAEKFLESHP